MAICNCPTITFPNGGETITGRAIAITWYAPTPHHPENIAVWYELFFTDDYEEGKKNEWMQIASLPAEIELFNWTVPFGVKSDQCRLAIRCRDARGKRSDLSLIADNFEISRQSISQPAVLTPVSGAVYRRHVPITLGKDVVGGTTSQRAVYQIYYSSKSLNIDWTVVRENVPFGVEPFLFDVSALRPATDYEFKFLLVDKDGGVSHPVIVSDVSILSLNYVYLDTEPPKGTIQVQPSKQFTNKKDLIIKLVAFDEITDVETVNIRQVAGSTVEDESERKFSGVQTLRIAGEDGIKTLEAQFRDSAGNVLDPNITSGQRTLRTFFNNDDQAITAFAIDGEDVWSAFSDGSNFSLYKNRDSVGDLDGEATFMTIFDGIPYIGIKTDEEKGTLVKFIDGEVTSVNVFDDVDSFINSLEVFGDDLYIAFRHGGLDKFDGTSFTTIDSFDTQIKAMGASVDALCLFFENTADISLYDGASIAMVEVLNGRL